MRILVNILLAGAALLPVIRPAAAAWPEKPVTIIVPAAPGGGADASARILAQKMAPALGQPVLADNRPGGGGIVASQALMRAAPDGYTLIMGNIGPNAINYSLYKKLPYKPTDFTPITLVLSNALVLVVNAGSPFKTVGDLVAALKKEPKRHSFGSSGIGQSPHLAVEMSARFSFIGFCLGGRCPAGYVLAAFSSGFGSPAAIRRVQFAHFDEAQS